MKSNSIVRFAAILLALFFACLSFSSALCETKTAKDKAYEKLWDNPTEANLIEYADAAFGKATKFTATSPMPKGKTGIALLFAHKKYGSILLISSNKYGNLYWEYDEDSVPDACGAFALAAGQFDIAVFMNEKSGTKLQGEGSEVTAGMAFMFAIDIGESLR